MFTCDMRVVAQPKRKYVISKPPARTTNMAAKKLPRSTMAWPWSEKTSLTLAKRIAWPGKAAAVSGSARFARMANGNRLTREDACKKCDDVWPDKLGVLEHQACDEADVALLLVVVVVVMLHHVLEAILVGR